MDSKQKSYIYVSTNVSNVSTNEKCVSTNVSTNVSNVSTNKNVSTNIQNTNSDANSCQPVGGKIFKHRQSKYNHEKNFVNKVSTR